MQVPQTAGGNILGKTRGSAFAVAITAVAACLALVVGVGTASAATITPDTFADEAGGDADNGNCALREAVISANTDTSEDACTPS